MAKVYTAKRNRRSGASITLALAEDIGLSPAADPDREGKTLPWVTKCEDHGTVEYSRSRSIGDKKLGKPDEWCDGCRVAYETGSGTNDGADVSDAAIGRAATPAPKPAPRGAAAKAEKQRAKAVAAARKGLALDLIAPASAGEAEYHLLTRTAPDGTFFTACGKHLGRTSALAQGGADLLFDDKCRARAAKVA